MSTVALEKVASDVALETSGGDDGAEKRSSDLACARRLGKQGLRRLGRTMYDVMLVWWSLFLLSFVMWFVVGCIVCINYISLSDMHVLKNRSVLIAPFLLVFFLLFLKNR
jgi:hypothetical protein